MQKSKITKDSSNLKNVINYDDIKKFLNVNRFKFFLFLFLLNSCVGPEVLRSANRQNITKININDSSFTVISIMGQEGTSGLLDNVTNPYTKEILMHKGQNYSIWYYYTERIGEKNWENGVTPVVFLNDKVIGVGWRSMEKLELDSKSSTIRIK